MSIKLAEDYLKEPYARVLVPDEGGGYVAEILEFEGCFTEGETTSRALKNLEKVAKSWVEARLEAGMHIPEPYAYAEMSGRFALRMPQSLHTKAAILAERDQVSLNTFIVSAVAVAVGAKDLYAQMADRFAERYPLVVNNFYLDGSKV